MNLFKSNTCLAVFLLFVKRIEHVFDVFHKTDTLSARGGIEIICAITPFVIPGLKRATFISNTCHIWERVVFEGFDFPYLEESSISRA